MSEQTTSTSSSQQHPKALRVLACVLCQQRKVKCNRQFPCTNCIRLNATCVPATISKRRRRRQFSEAQLLDRLRRYEHLLRQNSIYFDPLPNEPEESTVASEVDSRNGPDTELSGRDRLKPSTAPAPKIVYEQKDFWYAMNKGGRDVDDDRISSDDDVGETTVKRAWDQLFAQGDCSFLGYRRCSVELKNLHPEPVRIIRLWQVYLENINPMFMVTHTPTLQGRIIDAASNVADIEPVTEALMFSIYCISIQSMTEEDCQRVLSSSRKDILAACQFGCEQALLNCGVSRTNNRECLTALFLYFVSFGLYADPRSLSSMFGVAIRIAQRMGIDSEQVNSKCAIFEAEMRRRLWWSLVLIDSRTTELGGLKSSTLNPTWTCKVPMNVNDSDIWPGMKESPMPQSKPSESVFAVVRGELGEYIRHAEFYLDFTAPTLKMLAKNNQRNLEKGGLDYLEETLNEKYMEACDLGNPVHFMTACATRGYLARCRLIEHYAASSHASTEQRMSQADIALQQAICMLEYDTKIMTSPLTRGFLWLSRFYFPFPAYVHISHTLKQRPLGELASQAWDAMGASFDARFNGLPMTNPLFGLLLKVVSQAWEARKKSYRANGLPLTVPKIVSHIQSEMTLMSFDERNHDATSSHVPASMSCGCDNFSMSMPIGNTPLCDGKEPEDTPTEPIFFDNIVVPELSPFNSDGMDINYAGVNFPWGGDPNW
ncbi:hypothetical protein BDV59DRAFT_180644 [Aspergillus ambiguus]|uniref:uncharacterized protein n=1 Tax=Aspergillus ambiguus TaxID=176160 RepID=UPI003CCE0941